MLESDTIKITRHEAGIYFIDILHPWSDARGNPFANAWPPCQLREVMHYIIPVPGRRHTAPLLRMDTLCVPLGELLRNTAVTCMAKEYASAAKVLVLGEVPVIDAFQQ